MHSLLESCVLQPFAVAFASTPQKILHPLLPFVQPVHLREEHLLWRPPIALTLLLVLVRHFEDLRRTVWDFRSIFELLVQLDLPYSLPSISPHEVARSSRIASEKLKMHYFVKFADSERMYMEDEM